jgi:hypothetical protein
MVHGFPSVHSYWEVPRSEAKALAKELGGAFGVPEASGKAGGGTGQRGMPNVRFPWSPHPPHHRLQVGRVS